MALKRCCDNCDREITEKQVSADDEGGTQFSAKIGKKACKEIVIIRYSVFMPGNGTAQDMCVNCVSNALLAISDVPVTLPDPKPAAFAEGSGFDFRGRPEA